MTEKRRVISFRPRFDVVFEGAAFEGAAFEGAQWRGR